MGEWINRPAIQQDWMSLLYLLNFFLVTALYFFNPNRLKSLLSINKLSFYFSKFGDDTNFMTFRAVRALEQTRETLVP